MGFLRQYLNAEKRERKSSVVTARISPEVYEQFSDYCDSLGISISEAVNLLIKQELGALDRKLYEANLGGAEETAASVENVYKRNTKEKQREYKKYTKNISSSKSTQRFTTAKWKIHNELPCPLCNTWTSSSNMSRHAKQYHNMTTQELFTQYAEKVDSMLQDRLENKA